MSTRPAGVSRAATVTPAVPPGCSRRTAAPSNPRPSVAAVHRRSRCRAAPSSSLEGATVLIIASASALRSEPAGSARVAATGSPDCRRPRAALFHQLTIPRCGQRYPDGRTSRVEDPALKSNTCSTRFLSMGWSNPPVPWREIERRLSGRVPGVEDAPVSRRKRPSAAPTEIVRPESVTPYAELHCHSHFSFLDGASSPTDLVVEGSRLGLSALALTDHDNFAGAPLF